MPANPKKRVTSIKAIAELADCSIATVSNTLNNKGRISQEVRDNILSICRQHRYLPNSGGRNLRRGKNETIGLMFYPTCSAIFRNIFYAEIVEALEATMESRGYDLLLSGYDLENMQEPPRFVRQGKTDGVILLGGFPRSIVQQLHSYGVPLLHLDNYRKNIPIDNVTTDGFGASGMIVEHLAALEHKRLLFLAHKHEDTNADQRETGFLAALKQHRLPVTKKSTIRDFSDTAGAYRLLKAALRSKTAPTAVVCVNDTLAAEISQCLQDDGYRVPADISIFGFNDDEDSRSATPALSTVRVDKESLGRIGAETILARIDDPGRPLTQIRLPVELVHRESGAAPKGI